MVPVKSKEEISQNFVAFKENINFKCCMLLIFREEDSHLGQISLDHTVGDNFDISLISSEKYILILMTYTNFL